MFWALEKHDLNNFLVGCELDIAKELIKNNDELFKPQLDNYKYAVRLPEKLEQEYRSSCETFLNDLGARLTLNEFLVSNNKKITDIAIFPFVRQFTFSDKDWFNVSLYENIKVWLNKSLSS